MASIKKSGSKLLSEAKLREWGWTPLDWAEWQGHTQIVKCLVEHSATVDVLDQGGRTPLHRAACNGHTQTVECLVKQSASMDICDEVGQTGYGVCRTEALKILLECHPQQYMEQTRGSKMDESVECAAKMRPDVAEVVTAGSSDQRLGGSAAPSETQFGSMRERYAYSKGETILVGKAEVAITVNKRNNRNLDILKLFTRQSDYFPLVQSPTQLTGSTTQYHASCTNLMLPELGKSFASFMLLAKADRTGVGSGFHVVPNYVMKIYHVIEEQSHEPSMRHFVSQLELYPFLAGIERNNLDKQVSFRSQRNDFELPIALCRSMVESSFDSERQENYANLFRSCLTIGTEHKSVTDIEIRVECDGKKPLNPDDISEMLLLQPDEEVELWSSVPVVEISWSMLGLKNKLASAIKESVHCLEMENIAEYILKDKISKVLTIKGVEKEPKNPEMVLSQFYEKKKLQLRESKLGTSLQMEDIAEQLWKFKERIVPVIKDVDKDFKFMKMFLTELYDVCHKEILPGDFTYTVFPASAASYYERLAVDPRMPREELYSCEEFRLQSFLGFPKTVNVGVVLLAKAGFWYTGNGDEVACFSCDIHLNNWSPSKDPFVRHQEESPDCDFVNWKDENNVPYGSTDNPFNPNSRNTEAPGLVMTMVDGVDQIDCPDEVDRVMRVELSRIKTYTGWPASAPVFPDELASNGFFYTGSEDRVKCAFCAVILRDWEPSDRVATEHRSHSPSCIFVRNPNSRANGNIPLGSESLSGVDQPVNIAPNTADVLSDSGITASLGIDVERPRTPHYSQYDRRLESFKEWPRNHCQKKEHLSDAGFYFIGNGDNVKCFFCDGGLRNWEQQDDPITEHARWFPRCGYVRQKKGIEFIRGITEHFDQFYPELIPADQRATATADVVNISGSAFATASNLPGVEYTVEPREIKARMDTSKVRMVLDLGHRRTVVKQAIENQLKRNGDDFPSAMALLDAVMKIEEGVDETSSPKDSLSGSAATSEPTKPPALPQTAKPITQILVRTSKPDTSPQTQTPPQPPPTLATPPATAILPLIQTGVPSGGATGNVQNIVGPLLSGASDDPHDKFKALSSTTSGKLNTGSAISSEYESSVLEEENRHLKEQRQCKICMDNEVNVVFLPCGHLVCCQECGLALRTCPICRTGIRGTVKTFMS